MSEFKYKLKKDGKTVGYERRKRTARGNRMVVEHRKPDGKWKVICCGPAAWAGWIDHDEICTFVCLDRNGKEVYEGDRIYATGLGLAWERQSGTVEWNKEDLQWYFQCVQGAWRLAESTDNIELIEDQP